jgi:signal transduction histidine kinase
MADFPALSRRHRFPKSALTQGWRAFFGQARTRILFWYVVLMVFFFVACIPMMQKFVIADVNARVQEDLEKDIEAFHELLKEQSLVKTRSSEGVASRSQKNTPLTTQELKTFFQAYFNWQIPEDDTFLIAFVNRKFFGSSPIALPASLKPEQDLMQLWSILEESQQGKKILGDQISSILYIAEPIQSNSKILGVVVVAHMTNGEREEAFNTLIVVIKVMAWVLLVTLLLTWWVAGRVLTPLRRLAQTAQGISESDLTQRLSVSGGGEIAELATLFNEMMDRLQAAFASQREFVNDAGHELKTPITIIQGHLELMGDDPEERRETVTLVMDELKRMNRLVNDLLLLAKAERPDFLVLETIDIGKLTEELYAKVVVLADRHWQLEAVARGFIIIDRQRITEAMVNLVQNATQYTQVGDKIAIGSSFHGDRVCWWVRDTGEGIPLPDQQRIFERFARAAGNCRRSEGSGLGLSIVQAIVEAHRGNVRLHSQPGAGSTFTIDLPVDPQRQISTHDQNPDC